MSTDRVIPQRPGAERAERGERARRQRRNAVVALPNGFTLANLFFGIFAVVAASRGDFDAAARFIVFGAIADTLDGRIARATKSGSRFGEELDSLVDAISFGTAPGLIMYFAVFRPRAGSGSSASSSRPAP